MGHEELYREMLKQSESLNRVLRILETDEKIDSEGLVKKVNRLDHEIKEIQSERMVERAKLSLLGTIGGVVGSVLWFFIKKIIE